MAGNGTRYTDHEIERMLGEADDLLDRGRKVDEVIARLGVNKMTYYRWRKAHRESAKASHIERRLSELEHENARLRKLVAMLSTDRLA